MSKSKNTSKAEVTEITEEVIETAEEAVEEVTPAALEPEAGRADEAGFCCYIGPNILGVVQGNTIMTGSVADARKALAPAIEKFPLIRSLIVDGNELAAARVKVKTPGNILYVNYHRLVSGKK